MQCKRSATRETRANAKGAPRALNVYLRPRGIHSCGALVKRRRKLMSRRESGLLLNAQEQQLTTRRRVPGAIRRIWSRSTGPLILSGRDGGESTGRPNSRSAIGGEVRLEKSSVWPRAAPHEDQLRTCAVTRGSLEGPVIGARQCGRTG